VVFFGPSSIRLSKLLDSGACTVTGWGLSLSLFENVAKVQYQNGLTRTMSFITFMNNRLLILNCIKIFCNRGHTTGDYRQIFQAQLRSVYLVVQHVVHFWSLEWSSSTWYWVTTLPPLLSGGFQLNDNESCRILSSVRKRGGSEISKYQNIKKLIVNNIYIYNAFKEGQVFLS